jgi:hypothetical protein
MKTIKQHTFYAIADGDVYLPWQINISLITSVIKVQTSFFSLQKMLILI